jgi:hypothetical protein
VGVTEVSQYVRAVHENQHGYVIIRMKHTERWILMQPPVRALDDDWIEQIGSHFKDYRMAKMECDRLNSLVYAK